MTLFSLVYFTHSHQWSTPRGLAFLGGLAPQSPKVRGSPLTLPAPWLSRKPLDNHGLYNPG